MSKWISVEERLPEADVDIYVYIATEENVSYGYRSPWVSGVWWVFDGETLSVRTGVTHWQPWRKPEPPPSLFVGCSDSDGGETTVTTNAPKQSDSTQRVVEFDTAAMDG